MTIGSIIRDRRKELNMTQEDLAIAVGTTKATVSRWESGDIHKMKRSMMAALARVRHRGYVHAVVLIEGGGGAELP